VSAALGVDDPGVFTTVQDLGRAERRAGVPTGGAMDRFALAAANLLVGNPEHTGALECTLAGPVLAARASCLVAITGADFQPAVNDEPVPVWTSLFLAEGDRLSFQGRRWGARCYIAVAGGIKAERWLGSVSTYLLVGRGGLHGRPLKKGDLLELATEPPHPMVAGRNLPVRLRPAYLDAGVLRAVPGPHFRVLAPAGRKALFAETYGVSREADRMGYRLEGRELELKGEELISFGLAFGAVQVPNSGQPILLMADHQTAGGYPAVAGVARADLPLAAQLVPGDKVRFEQVTVESAQQAWRALRAGLDSLKA
jgi:antagonist of KipI